MKKTKQPLSLALATFALAVAMGSISIQGNLTRADFSIDTGDFELNLGGGDSAANGTVAPGCQGSNCLTVPGGSSYKGIAGTGDFRQSLLNWTNFFLGFLAIVAMIVLLYSGFLYVTAAGNQEQADKAKKTIVWVATGIIVILLAYSAVNTLISKGATGSDANLLKIFPLLN